MQNTQNKNANEYANNMQNIHNMHKPENMKTNTQTICTSMRRNTQSMQNSMQNMQNMQKLNMQLEQIIWNKYANKYHDAEELEYAEYENKLEYANKYADRDNLNMQNIHN